MSQSAGKRRPALADLSNSLKKNKNDHYTVGKAVEETSEKMKMRLQKA
jgi:hypothetical protein